MKAKPIYKVFLVLALAVFAAVVICGAVEGAAPYPQVGTAVVDGDPSEWNPVADFFAFMLQPGPAPKDRAVLNARYDCAGTVYVFVDYLPGYRIRRAHEEHFVKVNGRVVVGDHSPSTEFAYTANGWEARFPVTPDSTVYIQVHSLFEPNDTAYTASDLIARCDATGVTLVEATASEPAFPSEFWIIAAAVALGSLAAWGGIRE